MAEVNAVIHRDHYRTHINTATNSLTADEPLSVGGTDEGMSPEELLAASLSACTSITLRMYADRKGYDVDEIHVNVVMIRDKELNRTNINRKIEITGNLTDEERAKMMAIANNCPVHKILTNQIIINTES
ncbi:osmotically inducible protein OsmC [Flavipsychrobacter stenotrophus]|uniref:Osmotically inducible protein OsmC n=1 Tax=Flavipsychrobacter stenotrophus TaxID=2077091 RepID=A0A2S7T1P0_9BACT|nr:OsmC family protein [Flavipsychrobacter stenotrophus]PQJ13120.1 osmotically inducible protein OsmC [Flavipsychrobacter stenotrophus]